MIYSKLLIYMSHECRVTVSQVTPPHARDSVYDMCTLLLGEKAIQVGPKNRPELNLWQKFSWIRLSQKRNMNGSSCFYNHTFYKYVISKYINVEGGGGGGGGGQNSPTQTQATFCCEYSAMSVLNSCMFTTVLQNVSFSLFPNFYANKKYIFFQKGLNYKNFLGILWRT